MLELGLAELGTVVTYNPWSVSAETPLSEMVRMLSEGECFHWPVVDADQQLIGIVSEIDIVRALEERAAAAAFRDESMEHLDELQRCSVRDFMTRRPVTVDDRASLATVLRLLREHDVKALPVMQQDQLVGLITCADILRDFSYGEWPAGSDTAMETLEPAAEPIDWDASLEDAAIALRLAEASYVGVVRADFPLGVIADRDVRGARCRATSQQFSGTAWCLPGPTTVRELVAAAPTIRPGERLAEAAAILVDRQRRAAAVCNKAGRLLGAVTEDGILGRLTERVLG